MALTSSVSPLRPVACYDVSTGEELEWSVAESAIRNLLSFVKQQVEAEWGKNQARVLEVCSLDYRVKPAEWARQNGLKLPSKPPHGVKAVSRVEKLYQAKIVSEVTSYARNSNSLKQAPSFAPTVNLGAVDKHMASLSLEGLTLSLLWKCWDREFLLEFALPAYLSTRDITKFSLPIVGERDGSVLFHYSYQETPQPRAKSSQSAGVDLGRVEPFTLAVLNKQERRIAHYVASPRLKQLNRKRETLLKERSQTLAKLTQYKALNHNPLKQVRLANEADLIRGKIRRLGTTIAWLTANEITKKIAKHSANTLKVEDLTWVQGNKYGGRWNHANQQEAITHSLARAGVQVRKVNPKNTSQECHKCGTKLIHNSKTRSVHCVECKLKFDRDFNAAMNIAKKPPYPAFKRKNGDSYSSEEQTVNLHPENLGAVKRSSLPRNTT